MIEEFVQYVSDNTIVVMYEPGAGGDFVCAQIALAQEIYGASGYQRNINDGRVKSQSNKYQDVTINSQKIFDDYKFWEQPDLYSEILDKLLDLQNIIKQVRSDESRYISKVHPMIFVDSSNTQKLHDTLVNKYCNSKKVLVTRDELICKQNHILKNGYNYDIDTPEMLAYSTEWYKHFNYIDESFDIHHINLGELMQNPIRTYMKLMNFLELGLDNIIVDRFKEQLCTYVEKQTFIEQFKG